MKTTPQLKNTAAFFIQSAVSFSVAVAGVGLGIAYMPAPAWIRAFLAMGMLYVITATFTLAKVIRDRQEIGLALARAEQPSHAMPPNGPYVDSSSAAWG